MIHEPIISIPVLSFGVGKRKQYLTTLSLKSLLLILSPVIQRKDEGAGLRADTLAAKRLANEWRKRGEVECIKPIVVAVSGDCCFVPSETWQRYGAGKLECPLSAILEVCDGIQRLMAIKSAIRGSDELLKTEWPVHLIQTADTKDLTAVTEMIRKQTTIKPAPSRSRKSSPDQPLKTKSTQ